MAQLTVEARNFELKSVVISMFREAQFGGAQMEDPNLRFSVF